MFGVIHFDKRRYNFKFTPKPWSNQRKAAAKRALKRAREKAGLFGEELMEFTTVEDRLTSMDNNCIQRVKLWRDSDAKLLWEIRKKFRALDKEAQNELIEHWNESTMPKEPFRFASLLERYERDPLTFKRDKGLVYPYTKVIINNGVSNIVEISKEEYWNTIYRIDSNK